MRLRETRKVVNLGLEPRWRVVGRFKRLARPTPTIIVSCINRNAGMDVQSRVIRLDGKGSRGVAPAPLPFAHFCLPPKNGKRVYEKIWIANERVKVITAAIVGRIVASTPARFLRFIRSIIGN